MVAVAVDADDLKSTLFDARQLIDEVWRVRSWASQMWSGDEMPKALRDLINSAYAVRHELEWLEMKYPELRP